MSAPFKRHYATARSGNAGASGMRMALDCARGVSMRRSKQIAEEAALDGLYAVRTSPSVDALDDAATARRDGPNDLYDALIRGRFLISARWPSKESGLPIKNGLLHSRSCAIPRNRRACTRTRGRGRDPPASGRSGECADR